MTPPRPSPIPARAPTHATPSSAVPPAIHPRSPRLQLTSNISELLEVNPPSVLFFWFLVESATCFTTLKVTPDNAAELARAERTRWQIANEQFNSFAR